jgi:hypothetical protein
MKNDGNGHLAVRQMRKCLGITNQNFQLALINTYKYFQIKTNQTESSKKMIYRECKGRRYQTTTLTSQNVQQKITNRVNFIGDVRLCELFSRWLQ